MSAKQTDSLTSPSDVRNFIYEMLSISYNSWDYDSTLHK